MNLRPNDQLQGPSRRRVLSRSPSRSVASVPVRLYSWIMSAGPRPASRIPDSAVVHEAVYARPPRWGPCWGPRCHQTTRAPWPATAAGKKHCVKAAEGGGRPAQVGGQVTHTSDEVAGEAVTR